MDFLTSKMDEQICQAKFGSETAEVSCEIIPKSK
jgi:hypothetical protein